MNEKQKKDRIQTLMNVYRNLENQMLYIISQMDEILDMCMETEEEYKERIKRRDMEDEDEYE